MWGVLKFSSISKRKMKRKILEARERLIAYSLIYLFSIFSYAIMPNTDIQILITDNSNSISQISLIRPMCLACIKSARTSCRDNKPP